MMAAGFLYESPEERRVSAYIGMVFSAIYAALIFLVYFAQTTTVRLEDIWRFRLFSLVFLSKRRVNRTNG
jgi:hypothetical protein